MSRLVVVDGLVVYIYCVSCTASFGAGRAIRSALIDSSVSYCSMLDSNGEREREKEKERLVAAAGYLL